MPNQKTINARLLRTRARQYRDVNLNFIPHPLTGDLSVLTNFDAIKASIKNILLTQKLEKYFRPLFGSTVSSSLFEPLDGLTTAMVSDSIRRAISNYESRVTVISVNVDESEELNELLVSLKFSVINDPGRLVEFDFALERVR